MEPADNLSCVLHGIKDIRMEDRDIPTIKGNQLLIRVHTVGICGSDVHYWVHGAIGQYVVKEPMVLGHETSGVVVACGDDVQGFSKGDRVALEPGIPCRQCDLCKRGVYNLCPDVKFFATPPIHGSLARYVAHDADFCFKLPDNMSMEDGSLLEPLSVAVYACRRAQLSPGQRVLILGAGPIGLVNLLTAKASGASKVILTDLKESRLNLAAELGADEVLNVTGLTPDQVARKVAELLGGQPDVSLECTGAATCLETGILATKSGGVMVMIGCGDAKCELPIINAALRQVDLRGVFRYANCYPTAVGMVASGAVKLGGLTRAFYTLEEAPEAFKRAQQGDVIKVFIKC